MPVAAPASKYLSFDAARIGRTINIGYVAMERFRQVRTYIMREFAGPWYNAFYESMQERDDITKRPVSLFKRVIDTYLPHLCGTEIHCPVSPKLSGMRGPSKLRELMLEHICREIGLARTHRLVIMDALLGGLGLYKIGTRAGTNIIKIAGEEFDIGQFYAARVDLDDFCRDPNSRDPQEDTWRAFRYRVSKSFLLESGVYDNALVEDIPTIRYFKSLPGTSETIGKGTDNQMENIVDQVELWDVIVYDGDKVYEMTIAPVGTTIGANGFLMEPREYQGPERGPLIEMRPRELPNNAFPVSICGQLLDLHLLESMLGTKAARRMLAQCRKVFWKPDEEDQAIEVTNNTDDELLRGEWNGEQVDMGGLDQSTAKGLEIINTWANNETANLQQTGGNNDPNAKTATVGMILQGNSQVRLNDLKNMTDDALRKVVRCMAWDLDNDPFKQQKFSVRVPGGNMVDVMYDAAKKKGSFDDFLYDVQAISEEPTDPRQKQAAFAQMMQVSMPWLAGIAQLGGNVPAAIRIISDVYNRPELDEIFPTPDSQQIAMAQQQAAMVPGPGQVVGMLPAGPSNAAPSTPKPGQVRRPVDQAMADRQPQMNGAM